MVYDPIEDIEIRKQKKAIRLNILFGYAIGFVTCSLAVSGIWFLYESESDHRYEQCVKNVSLGICDSKNLSLYDFSAFNAPFAMCVSKVNGGFIPELSRGMDIMNSYENIPQEEINRCWESSGSLMYELRTHI